MRKWKFGSWLIQFLCQEFEFDKTLMHSFGMNIVFFKDHVLFYFMNTFWNDLHIQAISISSEAIRSSAFESECRWNLPETKVHNKVKITIRFAFEKYKYDNILEYYNVILFFLSF